MNTSQSRLANTKSQPALDQIDGRLLTELANSKLLHDLSTQLIHQDKPGGLYERILDAAITIMHSRFASLQIFCREKGNEGELQLIGFRGFSPKAAKFWEWVRIDSGSSCGAALREGKRVVVPDTEQCDFMVGSDDLAAYAETGIRAVQSTPLLSRSGNFVGMLSTHWDVPHVPAESALRFLDILARQAADLIERTRNQAELEIKVKERTAEIAKAQQDLQALSSRILQIQDEERRRLARELHDSAGQMLAVLNLQLDQTAQLVKKVNPRLAENIESSRALVQRLVQGIRTTSYLLHPPLLDEQGLSSALGWYVDGIRQRSGLDIKLVIPDDLGRVGHDLELTMFRLVQECLTNILRHSESKNAVVRILQDAESICIEVQDAGKGISAAKLADIHANRTGVGLQGMRERVRRLRGSMDIKSNGFGTKISFTLPCESIRNS